MFKWFSGWWYKYLFAPKSDYSDAGCWTVLWCRLRNHPAGPIWYNLSYGDKPNMHCKNCGDLLE